MEAAALILNMVPLVLMHESLTMLKSKRASASPCLRPFFCLNVLAGDILYFKFVNYFFHCNLGDVSQFFRYVQFNNCLVKSDSNYAVMNCFEVFEDLDMVRSMLNSRVFSSIC